MQMRCEVKIPKENESYKKSMSNLKKEWAAVMMQEHEDGCIPGELIKVSGKEGIVKFYNGVLLCLPVEYIRILE